MKCRHCQAELQLQLIDLGAAPPSNAYLTGETLHASEKYFPLRVLVCTECWLAQTEDYAGVDELFSADYAYFSSYSATWLKHAEDYVAAMVQRFKLNSHSYLIEVAANDGYLLQYVQAQGIPCLGIEPTTGTATSARSKGLEIIEAFFDKSLAEDLAVKGRRADLIVANNVLAHVPGINGFVAGFPVLLKPTGIATFEFPHLLRLISENQFDTIYHEHFSYLSLTSILRIFKRSGLEVFDLEELATHGGSIRVFAQPSNTGTHAIDQKVAIMLNREEEAGLTNPKFYANFQARADKVKNDLLGFLLEAKHAGKIVAGYGAAAKGNTLLNYAGVRPDLLPYVADRNPAKQGKYLPGSRIPIVAESFLRSSRPDYVVILPWNIRSEIMEQLQYIKPWGGRFVTAVPGLEVI